MMALSALHWSVTRKVAVGAALLIALCGVGLSLLYRELGNINFGKVVVYKEGVGPSYEETLAGGAD